MLPFWQLLGWVGQTHAASPQTPLDFNYFCLMLEFPQMSPLLMLST